MTWDNNLLPYFDRYIAGDDSGFLAVREAPGSVELKGSGSVQVGPLRPSERGPSTIPGT